MQIEEELQIAQPSKVALSLQRLQILTDPEATL